MQGTAICPDYFQ